MITPAGMPVRKMASMSGRVLDGPLLYVARFGNTPGYSAGQQLGQQRAWQSS